MARRAGDDGARRGPRNAAPPRGLDRGAPPRDVHPGAPPRDLTAVAARLGVVFRDAALLSEALTHSSATGLAGAALPSNERLEFLGDRVLGLLMAEWLIERFPTEREGLLMRRFGTLVAAETLAGIAARLGLGDDLLVASDPAGPGIQTRPNVLADAMEALLGALYRDGGLEAVRPFFRRIYAPLVEAEPDRPPLPAKSRLQEWLQGRGHPLPVYALVSAEGPSHAPVFIVTVTAAGRDAQGRGGTRRAAELAAAEAWLAGVGT
ncbi:ribonuclease III [Roseomonas sp. CECT 9278]|uniref:ribonuclease III n=1 Tax=Roseomonas sp. CECT 9278 TaxID=2845823 RepID=UPI001E4A258D|nr:ribonuclease III [Roseomonas sp. CECT 9278]CAH0266363.1 Ribonuclease 3 [Roseomonas sp. CECT 9278]